MFRGALPSADVLVPKRWMIANKVAHHSYAFLVLQHFDAHTIRTKIIFRAAIGGVLPHDDVPNSVEDNRTAAHWAWRKRRINLAALVSRRAQPARVLQAIHLRMMNDAAFLHALVASCANDFAVTQKHGTYGDPALRKTVARLDDRAFQILADVIHAERD